MKDNYIIFARTATINQGLDGNSINAQINTLKKLAQERKLSVGEVITECGDSGVRKRRLAFNYMIEMLENGTAKGILCTDLSRLSRSSETLLELQILMMQKRIKIITPQETYGGDDERNLLLFSAMSIDAFYRRKHSRAIKKGLQAKRLKC